MQKREQVRPGIKNMEVSTENPGGASETVEKSKLNSSCKAEKKITLQKMN